MAERGRVARNVLVAGFRANERGWERDARIESARSGEGLSFDASKKTWPIRVFTLNIVERTGKIQLTSLMNMRRNPS